MKKIFLTAVLMFLSASVCAQDIVLPSVQKTGGIPLMEAIGARRSNRVFGTQPLDKQVLSNLLWAAWGVSSEDGKRTIPTARNQQDAVLYVALPEGVYRYESAQNKLVQVATQDVRPLIARSQEFAKTAPLHLVFAAQDETFGAMHAGSMYQNAGLYCASVGLNNVVRGYFDKKALSDAMNLPADEHIIVTQAIGYPPNN